MPTIHDDIEPWLAAAVHDQLSKDERATFQQHLAMCDTCRALHEEELTMSKIIESTLEEAKPDLAFEQRVISRFRDKVPHRVGFAAILTNLLRLRATQITAVAAALLTLVQVGRLVTNDQNSPREGLRQLPSFAGNVSTKKETVGRETDAPADASQGENSAAPAGKPASPKRKSLDDAERIRSVGNRPEPGEKQDESLPVTVYGGPVSQKQASAAPEAAAPPDELQAKDEAAAGAATTERTVVTDSDLSTSEQETAISTGPADVNRKLVRNARVELEVIKFDDAVQKITAWAAEQRGFVATSSSEKQANGKLRGEVVVKVLPEALDSFLLKLRELGDLKNQTLGTDDVTKQYFDTDSHLKNARVMEQRLIDILRTKSTKVADLLEVEKELGRVREQIEEMQGSIKYMEAQVQFATVTVTLTEKEMNLPAAFLLKRRARLALFSTDVEKTFAEAKSVIDGAKAQVSSSTLDRDSSGETIARLALLIVPEEADALIDRIRGMGRVQNYSEQTDRVAQGGTGMAENAKVERDKVELSITISRNEQEPALQTTSLRIMTSSVNENVAKLKAAAKANGEIRSSSFSRDPDGREIANIMLRVPMKNYPALLASFDQLGKVKDLSVQRQDRRGEINEETAPADISIQVYSQPNIVSEETGLFATIRRTLAQGASALMWSLRMIGVAIAFLAPWAFALALLGWIVKRISRTRAARRGKENQVE